MTLFFSNERARHVFRVPRGSLYLENVLFATTGPDTVWEQLPQGGLRPHMTTNEIPAIWGWAMVRIQTDKMKEAVLFINPNKASDFTLEYDDSTPCAPWVIRIWAGSDSVIMLKTTTKELRQDTYDGILHIMPHIKHTRPDDWSIGDA